MTLHDIARRSVLLAALAAAWAPASAQAGVLSVSPVVLEFAPGQKALTTAVSNPGDRPMQVQVRLVRWSSEGPDGETYTPTRDIGFSPPMFELKAGERQIVRLMLRTGRDPARETAYRLIVDQLPDPDVTGVQMPVRMVLPVFVAPDAKGQGRLSWTATTSGGDVVVTARNVGPRRVKLVDLNFTSAGGVAERAPVRGYVLAGEARTWRVRTRAAAPAVQVNAKTEEGTLSVTVPLTRAG